MDLIDIKNAAGRTPLGEAEQAGWDEGAKWMVEVMRLDVGGGEEGVESIEKPTEIEIEVEGIEGDVAKMTVGGVKSDQPA